MECKIIQDLLPLYAEKLTSDESNKAIEEHLKGCPECMEALEGISAAAPPAPDRDIKPLKKARRSLLLRIPAILLSLALVLGGVFLFVFWGVVPMSGEDISAVIEIAGEENDLTFNIVDSEHNIVEERTLHRPLSITFMGCCSCIRKDVSVHYDYNPDGTMTGHYDVTVYKCKKLPFDDMGEHPNEWNFATDPKRGETLTLHCRDTFITYDLWELYQQYADGSSE